MANLGICYDSLGDCRQAINLPSRDLAIARDIGNRAGEGNAFGNLRICHYSLGDYRQAINLHTQALAIDRDIGYRKGEGTDVGNSRYLPLQPG